MPDRTRHLAFGPGVLQGPAADGSPQAHIGAMGRRADRRALVPVGARSGAGQMSNGTVRNE